MKVISETVEILNNKNITTKYIEDMLTNLNITPLRWAIIDVGDTMIKVSVANLKKEEG